MIASRMPISNALPASLSLTLKKGKDKNENKNIIDTQAPFHQVGGYVFYRCYAAFYPP